MKVQQAVAGSRAVRKEGLLEAVGAAAGAARKERLPPADDPTSGPLDLSRLD